MSQSLTLADHGPSIPFVLLDEATIVAICNSHGLTVAESNKYDLMLTASQLQKGEMTTPEFCTVAKSWVSLLSAPAMGPFHNAPQILSASLDVTKATAEVAAAIKERAVTANMSARYLSALELATGLAPESIRIVAAVQELTEKSIIEHEVVEQQAEAKVIEEFLTKEIAPTLEHLEQGQSTAYSINLVQRIRVRLETRIEAQRKALHILRQRVEQGVSNMRQATYYAKTNLLQTYAAACSLEILLCAYHAILGLLDPEHSMVANDWKNLNSTAIKRCQSIATLFSRYILGRLSLLETKSEYVMICVD